MNDDDLHDDFNQDVVPLFETDEDDLLQYEGDDGTIHMAESRVRLTTSGMDSEEEWNYDYMVGFQIYEDDIL